MELFKKKKERKNDNDINNNKNNEMIIEYIIKNENEIKLFGKKFIINNINNCKIIINNKEQDISEYLNVKKI